MELGNTIRVSNVYLGWIRGTNLRANALGPNGKKIGDGHHKHSSRAIDIDDCTTKILQGIEKNKKAIYIPSILRFIPVAKLFFRKWLFRKINKVTSQEER
jgi:short-subunit dehydrogenase